MCLIKYLINNDFFTHVLQYYQYKVAGVVILGKNYLTQYLVKKKSIQRTVPPYFQSECFSIKGYSVKAEEKIYCQVNRLKKCDPKPLILILVVFFRKNK